MNKTATLAQDGLYDLSEPLMPFADGLSFSRLAAHTLPDGTLVVGIGSDGQEHPVPLVPKEQAPTPAAALAVLGYTLA